MSDKTPSPEFMDAVIIAGSPVIDCEMCGRTHFAPDSDLDFESGELEGLEESHRRGPNRYIRHEGDSVSWGRLGGKQVVDGCPCLGLSERVWKYEQFFLKHSHIILKFFQNRAERLTKESTEAERLARGLLDSLPLFGKEKGAEKKGWDTWLPTSENINALPLPLREFIHELETRFGATADLVQDNAALRQQNAELTKAIEEMKGGKE